MTFSYENDYLPSPPPTEWHAGDQWGHKACYSDCLPLTRIERKLISSAVSIVHFHIVFPERIVHKGHTVSMNKDTTLYDQIPRMSPELEIFTVRRGKNAENVQLPDLYCRRKVVRAWCEMLVVENPKYKHIKINSDVLNSLPEEGYYPVPDKTMVEVPKEAEREGGGARDNENSEVTEERGEGSVERFERDAHEGQVPEENFPAEQGPLFDHGPDDGGRMESMTESVVFNNPQGEREVLKIQRALLKMAKNQVDYPTVGDKINEFKTQGLFTMVFPDLFPDGRGDPTDVSDKKNKIPLYKWARRALKYAVPMKKPKPHFWYPFQDAQFMYYVFNRIRRHQLIAQAQVYIDRNHGFRDMSVQELGELMEKNKNSDNFLRGFYRRQANVSGTAEHARAARNKLVAMTNGHPTCFCNFNYGRELAH